MMHIQNPASLRDGHPGVLVSGIAHITNKNLSGPGARVSRPRESLRESGRRAPGDASGTEDKSPAWGT